MGAAVGIELRFPPTPGHVRTARLVAAAVARRARLEEALAAESADAPGPDGAAG